MTRGFYWVWTLCLFGVALSCSGQSNKTQTGSMYRNIQVMKGISDKEIDDAMKAFNRELGLQCVACHIAGDNVADNKPLKVTARKMFQMVQTLNQQDVFKNGSRKADCYMCHKGASKIPPQPPQQ